MTDGGCAGACESFRITAASRRPLAPHLPITGGDVKKEKKNKRNRCQPDSSKFSPSPFTGFFRLLHLLSVSFFLFISLGNTSFCALMVSKKVDLT